MKRHSTDSAQSAHKPSRAETAKRDAGSQILFDFAGLSAPAPVATPPSRERPEWQFALRFATLMEAEPASTFDNGELSRLSREVFGMSAGRARDAYDAAEAGFNIYVERIGLDLSDPHAAIEWLVDEQARLPRQTRRDDVQVEFRQFSTPPFCPVTIHSFGLYLRAIAARRESFQRAQQNGHTPLILSGSRGTRRAANPVDPRRGRATLPPRRRGQPTVPLGGSDRE